MHPGESIALGLPTEAMGQAHLRHGTLHVSLSVCQGCSWSSPIKSRKRWFVLLDNIFRYALKLVAINSASTAKRLPIQYPRFNLMLDLQATSADCLLSRWGSQAHASTWEAERLCPRTSHLNQTGRSSSSRSIVCRKIMWHRTCRQLKPASQ
jgi:hypothetical protein